MQFAIRDDDTCFFTKPEDLEKAYDFLDDCDVVSLAVVPNSVPLHKELAPYGNHPYRYYPIEDNKNLVEYLRNKVELGAVDILLHGYSHEYKRNNNGEWISEIEWKDVGTLNNELSCGKRKLTTLFGKEIRVFVPPNNHIKKNGIQAMEKNKMNLSGILLFNDRKLGIHYFINFCKRWGFRIFKGFPYPGILRFRKHTEIYAFPIDSYERLLKEYSYCRSKNIPFVIYTHYWSLNQKNSKQKEILKDIVSHMKADGAKCVALSSLYENTEQ